MTMRVRTETEPAARRDRFRQLRAFCEVVQTGGISNAAKSLESSQPAVSTLMKRLEGELGVALFRRVGGRTAPTRIGKDLFQLVRPLVEGLLRLPELFDELHTGDTTEALRMGAGQVSSCYVLPDLVRRYQARHPRTRVQLRTGTGGERLAWLRGFELDVIVAAFDVVPRDLEFHPIAQADAVVITPKDHPLGKHKQVAIRALAHHPMIMPSAGSYTRQVQDAVLSLHGVRVPIAIEVDGWGTMINYVYNGVGIAIVPEVCIADHEPVRKVRLEHRFQRRTYGVAVRRNGLMGLAASRFVDLAMAGPAGTGGGSARGGGTGEGGTREGGTGEDGTGEDGTREGGAGEDGTRGGGVR